MHPDREGRIVSALNSVYLSEEALADIDRLGLELREGVRLEVCDYDAFENGQPAWLVADCDLWFDNARQQWAIGYSEVTRQPRDAEPP